MEPLQNLNHVQMIGEIKKIIEKFPPDEKNAIDQGINIALKLHWNDADRENEPYIHHIIRTMLRCLLLGLKEPSILIAGVLRKIPREKSAEFIKTYSDRKETPEDINGTAFNLLMEMFDFRTCDLIRQADLVLRIIETEEGKAGALLDEMQKNSKEVKLFLLAVLCDEIKSGQENNETIIKLGGRLIEQWDEKNNQYLSKPGFTVTETVLRKQAGIS